MTFRDDVEDILQLSMHLTDCLYHVSFPKYTPLKLPLNRKVVQKGDFGAPDLQGEGVFQISDMRFQITLTSDHVADFRSVPFSDLGDQAAKKKKEERKKHGSADILYRAA